MLEWVSYLERVDIDQMYLFHVDMNDLSQNTANNPTNETTQIDKHRNRILI